MRDQRETNYERAQRIARIGDWEWDVITNHVRWSDELYRIYGFAPGEVAPDYKLVLDQMHPESKEAFTAAIDAALNENAPFEMDYRFYMKDGSESVLHTIGEVYRDDNGSPVRMAGIVQDITERVVAERALRESESRFRSIFEGSSDGIIIADPETHAFIDANASVCQMLGYGHDELLKLRIEDIHPPEHVREVVDVFERQVCGELVVAEDLPMLRQDGSVFYADVSVGFILLERRHCIVGFFRDTTGRKEVTDRIRNREARYRAIFETTSDGFIITDATGEILEVNDSYVEQSGYSHHDLIGMNIAQMEAKETEEETASHIKKVIQSGADVFESRYRRQDGSMWDVEVSVSYWQIEGGRFFSFFRDITERKRLEQEREIFHNFYLASADLMCLGDGQRFVSVNPAFTELFGYSEDELKSIPYIEFIHPDDREHTLDEVERQLKTSSRIIFENRYVCKDGTVKLIAWRAIYDQEKGMVFATGRETTEQKQAEVHLAESESRLRESQAVAHLGHYDFDVLSNSWTSSEALDDVFGITPDFNRTADGWLAIVHPDEREAMGAYLAEYVIRDHNLFDREYRIIRVSDGAVRWVHGLGKLDIDAGGKAVRMFGVIQDITEQRQAEQVLRESEERFRSIIDSTPMGIHMYELHDDDRLVFKGANPAADAILGLDNSQFIGKTIEEAFPSLAETEVPSRYRDAARYGTPWHTEQFEYQEGRISGAFEVAAFRTEPMKMVTLFSDITERVRADEEQQILREQLAQVQKMESVGRLAGGIAHDFNNALQSIIGNTELAMRDLSPDSPILESLQSVKAAADHSAGLIRQLLAFARQQPVEPKVLSLNQAVDSQLPMLKRMMGENISVNWLPDAEPSTVKLDPTQLYQLLANLFVNAREAIAGIGHVTVETRNISLDVDYCQQHAGFEPGEFVMLEVCDDGCGMSPEIRDHLFEPFFTTREVGEGTGLGLATVYGIVKQNNGFINVYSEAGQGTCFKLYLPLEMEESPVKFKRILTPEIASGKGETILMVEDEPGVLKLGEKILSHLGYRVIAVASPEEALRLADDQLGELSLLITDVVMPEMNGKELAQRLQEKFPGLRCLYMSGYTKDVIATHGVLDEGLNFIQKPFSVEEISIKVRDVLRS